MAYEIIKRLEEKKENKLLDLLHGGVKKREQKKGQIHKVFENSFDAKECHSENSFYFLPEEVVVVCDQYLVSILYLRLKTSVKKAFAHFR
jgi:hypothetical protein